MQRTIVSIYVLMKLTIIFRPGSILAKLMAKMMDKSLSFVNATTFLKLVLSKKKKTKTSGINNIDIFRLTFETSKKISMFYVIVQSL